MAPLGTIAKMREQLKCSQMDEWIQKTGYVHTMQYYSDLKKDEIMPFLVTGKELEMIILSEVRRGMTSVI